MKGFPWAWALLLMVLSPLAAAGQQRPEATAPFRSVRCTQERGTMAEWVNGRPVTDPASDTSSYVFDGINAESGDARFIGNVGAADVFYVVAGRSLIFSEVTPAGNYIATTVFLVPLPDGSYPFVHSRHMSILGDPFVSQYYGRCRALG